MRERVVAFGPEGTLVGVAAEPEAGPASPLAVLFLNAGLLHRVGPNRLHVRIARRLAAAGVATLRFDLAGLGDSVPSASTDDFERRAVQQTIQAIDHLAQSGAAARFALFGMCSGADVALQVARADPRVAGAALVNGRLIDLAEHDALYREAERSALRRYYRSRALDPRSWLRLISGKSDVPALVGTIGRAIGARLARRRSAIADRAGAAAPELVEFAALQERPTDLLLVFSEGSASWDLAPRILGPQAERLRATGRLRTEYVRGVDHVFTLAWSQEWLTETIASWVERIAR